jgi:hypothetical protein
MKTLQQAQNCNRRRWYAVWILIALLLVATGIWILSIENVIQGSWATMLNALFTCVGVIFAILQCYAQMVPVKDEPSQDLELLRNPKGRKGSIVVYTNRKWRGTTLYLIAGLQEPTGSIEAVANVVEYQIAGHRRFCGRFLAVPPGHYTLMTPSRQHHVQITVRPGHLSEIDWR